MLTSVKNKNNDRFISLSSWPFYELTNLLVLSSIIFVLLYLILILLLVQKNFHFSLSFGRNSFNSITSNRKDSFIILFFIFSNIHCCTHFGDCVSYSYHVHVPMLQNEVCVIMALLDIYKHLEKHSNITLNNHGFIFMFYRSRANKSQRIYQTSSSKNDGQTNELTNDSHTYDVMAFRENSSEISRF